MKGHGEGVKIACAKCRLTKKLERFKFEKEFGFYHSSCMVCEENSRRKRFPKGKKKNWGCLERGKYAMSLRQKYGHTDSLYQILKIEQGETCAICGEKPEAGNWLVIDHDHCTGEVRGLLCRACNLGLGAFHDNEESLRGAVKFLRASRKREGKKSKK